MPPRRRLATKKIASRYHPPQSSPADDGVLDQLADQVVKRILSDTPEERERRRRENEQLSVQYFLKDLGLSRDALQALTREQQEEQLHNAIAALQPDELIAKIENSWPVIDTFGLDKTPNRDGPPRIECTIPEIEQKIIDWVKAKFTSVPAPVSHSVEPAKKALDHERQMQSEHEEPVFVRDGVRYRPLAAAASLAQAHRTTLLRWIKDETKVEGQPLQTYYFAPLDTYFISEPSIQRLANRFLKWPSEEPAGAVTLDETKDKSGFLGMSEAADIVGVSRRTMWLWVSQAKAPMVKPLDAIKDPISEHFYIREKDVYELKKFIPKRGLQRGRRSQLALQP